MLEDKATLEYSTKNQGRISHSSAHLRCDVVGRATEGGGGHSVHDAFLAHAEVCQLTVSLCIQQDVVQLQVPERERERENYHHLSP